ncbi:hypothetical protein FHS01_000671 [Longimicrobium terrae]|uniref:Uncharacterized protein n=1 Tax=Longimicrobium terrae TaxID=1639882 RepID=A0A841GUZ5_9BACT|nr:hypothetical protein [Longimicrobium terrae]MBB6068445.1 hypothetical protein [Longimicrobium terrae]
MSDHGCRPRHGRPHIHHAQNDEPARRTGRAPPPRLTPRAAHASRTSARTMISRHRTPTLGRPPARRTSPGRVSPPSCLSLLAHRRSSAARCNGRAADGARAGPGRGWRTVSLPEKRGKLSASATRGTALRIRAARLATSRAHIRLQQLDSSRGPRSEQRHRTSPSSATRTELSLTVHAGGLRVLRGAVSTAGLIPAARGPSRNAPALKLSPKVRAGGLRVLRGAVQPPG